MSARTLGRVFLWMLLLGAVLGAVVSGTLEGGLAWLREQPVFSAPAPLERTVPPAQAPAGSAAPPFDFGGGYNDPGVSVSRSQALAHYKLGSELLGFGDYYSAASHLAVARDSLGDFGRICELLAITYDRLNMTPDLLAVMECLAREARQQESARALYDHLARHLDVEVEFEAAASDHFVASFPSAGASSAAVGNVLAVLERARSEVAATIGIASMRLVPVVIYEGDQFAAATDKPHWALGIYDGKIRVAIDTFARDPGVFAVAVGHEYVHALTHEFSGTRLPAWFREGVADSLARRGTRLALPAAQQLGAAEPIFDYAELAGEFIDLREDQVAAAYHHSYALVKNLVTEAGWGPIEDLLRDLHTNEALDFDGAFAGVYGESPEAYVERWYDLAAGT